MTADDGTAKSISPKIRETNFLKFISTIALTILPLTSESQILIWVLKTSIIVNKARYFASLQFHDGTTIFISSLIFAKNTLSTFPFPYNLDFLSCTFPSNLRVTCPRSPDVDLHNNKINTATTPSYFVNYYFSNAIFLQIYSKHNVFNNFIRINYLF